MAREVYGFFDSTKEDERYYSEADMSCALRMISGDGVAALGDNLRVVSANDGLQTRVLCGAAMCRGFYFELQDDGGGPLILAHEAALSQPRVDRVVLRLNKNTGARSITIGVRKGSPGESPLPPELQRTDTVYELSLARVHVATGAGVLLDTDIADEREDEALCGILAPARVEWLLGRLNASGIPTGTPGENVQQALDGLDGSLALMLPRANVINDLITTDAGYALDARQGKALGERANDLSDLINDGATEPYTHTRDPLTGIHNFTGSGRPMGRSLITDAVQPGDTFSVNGVAMPAYMGEDEVEALPVGRWVPMINSGSQLDFSGGGGGGGKWRVLSGAILPTEARDRTIFAVTDVQMMGSIISDTLPITPYEGLLWVAVGVRDRAVSMAGDLVVHIINAFIYRAGNWEPVPAYYGKFGVWTPFSGILFSGGIAGVPWSHGQQSGARNQIAGIVGKNLQASTTSNSTPTGYNSLLTNDTISLANYKSLHVTVEENVSDISFLNIIGIHTVRNPVRAWSNALSNAVASYALSPNWAGTVSLDVSALAGAYYIGFSQALEVNRAFMLKVSRVWLE